MAASFETDLAPSTLDVAVVHVPSLLSDAIPERSLLTSLWDGFSHLQVPTTRFGTLEVAPENILYFAEGIIQFLDCKYFAFVFPEPRGPLFWLQSLEIPKIAFPVMEPCRFLPNYTPTLNEVDKLALGLTVETPKIYAIVNIPPQNQHLLMADLQAPLVINPATQQGRQCILHETRWKIRHDLLEAWGNAIKKAPLGTGKPSKNVLVR